MMRAVSALLALTVLLLTGCASTEVYPEPVGAEPPVTREDIPPAPDPVSSDRAEAAEPAAEEEPSDEELSNTLRWTTASEVENFGFDIYRATSEEGPFERMTEEPLPGAGTVDEPQSYVWVDSDIDPAVDYYYFIESISFGGVREKFSPVIKAPAKRP